VGASGPAQNNFHPARGRQTCADRPAFSPYGDPDRLPRFFRVLRAAHQPRPRVPSYKGAPTALWGAWGARRPTPWGAPKHTTVSKTRFTTPRRASLAAQARPAPSGFLKNTWGNRPPGLRPVSISRGPQPTKTRAETVPSAQHGDHSRRPAPTPDLSVRLPPPFPGGQPPWPARPRPNVPRSRGELPGGPHPTAEMNRTPARQREPVMPVQRRPATFYELQK